MTTPDTAPKSTSTSNAATRSWALDNASASVKIKPRRPYTPYNLFYLLERERVVQGNDPSASEERAKKKDKMQKERSALMKEREEDSIPNPKRYNGVIMLPMWYEPNLKEKRKHRKTHGKISFKDLTAIISKNWATIDPETKAYCTQISEMGRKRYKEQITRYNASQKIIQLKKEKEAMDNARETRLAGQVVQQQQQQQKKKKNPVGSPPRPKSTPTIVSRASPVTPDRVASHHHASNIVTPTIGTPPRMNGYNTNRTPTFVHSGSAHHSAHAARTTPLSNHSSGSSAAHYINNPFHQYGPPPPLPPPMPHHVGSQSSHHHQYDHRHLQMQSQMHMMYYQQQQQQNNRHSQYSYPQAHPMNKTSHREHNQALKTCNHDMKTHHGHNHHHNHRSPANGSPAARKPSDGSDHQELRNNRTSKPANVKAASVSKVKKEPQSPIFAKRRSSILENNKGSTMSHDEALQLCDLMGNSTPNESAADHQASIFNMSHVVGSTTPSADSLLRELPSFDFGDHHSLSSENESELGLLGQDDVNQEENNLMDLIGGEMPLEFGGQEFDFSLP